MALAKTITKFRRRQNLKRKFLADKLGVSLSAIDKMEQAVSNPSFSKMYLLSVAMDISFQEFAETFEIEWKKIPSPL
jgi:transcriptional regulator with XRE-family HTH domain